MAIFCEVCKKQLPADEEEEVIADFLKENPEIAAIFEPEKLHILCSEECLNILHDFLTTERPPTYDC